MNTYIKRTSSGELACSCCGYFIAGITGASVALTYDPIYTYERESEGKL